MYELRFSPKASKFLKKLRDKRLRAAFQSALNEIANDPSAGGAKSGDLAGIYGYDVYHNKTNYEIAYAVIEKDGSYVVVILAGTRENFYDELKRYWSPGFDV
ncbi:MAG: type II toxin-antitoxin system RelE/ParE family toxin [Oscillospiraceae bacterium]|nr:type II toxin-antitoxin system RelE/ParE family toxin [Oscillospiraceae bacterium]